MHWSFKLLKYKKWTNKRAPESLLKLNLIICINLIHSTSLSWENRAIVPHKWSCFSPSSKSIDDYWKFCSYLWIVNIVFPDTNDIPSFLFWKEKSPTRKKMQGTLLSWQKQWKHSYSPGYSFSNGQTKSKFVVFFPVVKLKKMEMKTMSRQNAKSETNSNKTSPPN